MRRLYPKSLIGQLALAMAAALLVAQAINFGLIFTERQRVSRAEIEGPAVSRFVGIVQRVASAPGAEGTELLPQRGRRGRFSIDSASAVEPGSGDAQLERRLRETAAGAGLALADARADRSDRAEPPRWLERLPPEAREAARRRHGEMQALVLSARLGDGRWVNARLLTPRPNPWIALRPAAATLLTYLIILAALLAMAVRLTRPLRQLTEAAERFHGRGEAPRVEPAGPADLQRAILAFNAMGARVSAMLDEKDRMLGAIGHDLRTPLASLRIRAEGVEPAEERERMVATIEEMTAMLEDTLALARSGRAVEEARAVDLAALADAVVEELRALGQPVEMEPGERLTARVRPNLLRRALRNLVENAVKYGGSARVAVREPGDRLTIEVTDEGPGVAEEELARVQEPFYRVERSRSRATGGSGLGLTLARAAAQAHGGGLELENRPQGGLLARIWLPGEGPAPA